MIIVNFDYRYILCFELNIIKLAFEITTSGKSVCRCRFRSFKHKNVLNVYKLYILLYVVAIRMVCVPNTLFSVQVANIPRGVAR